MNLKITGQHLEISQSLKEHIEKKLGVILERNSKISGCHVTLIGDSHGHIAQATMHLPGKDLHCESRDYDVYSAVDNLTRKVQSQLKTYKSKHEQASRYSAKRLLVA